MNDHQKKRFANNIVQTLYNTVSGKKIAFLGWAFKKDTNDTRESAAINVADYLLNEQANVTVYDPRVKEKQIVNDLLYLKSRSLEEINKGVTVFDDPYEVCKGAHAIAILTEWDEFKDYDWKRIYDNMKKPAFIFDGRNILDAKKIKEIGFHFNAIGRED
jgi:UDPglucose 6-dehydrogenase